MIRKQPFMFDGCFRSNTLAMAPKKKSKQSTAQLSPRVSSPSSRPSQAHDQPLFGLVQRMPQDEGHILPDGDGKIAQLVLYRRFVV